MEDLGHSLARFSGGKTVFAAMNGLPFIKETPYFAISLWPTMASTGACSAALADRPRSPYFAISARMRARTRINTLPISLCPTMASTGLSCCLTLAPSLSLYTHLPPHGLRSPSRESNSRM
eukprot:2089642-Rhodomonas_salina.2